MVRAGPSKARSFFIPIQPRSATTSIKRPVTMSAAPQTGSQIASSATSATSSSPTSQKATTSAAPNSAAAAPSRFADRVTLSWSASPSARSTSRKAAPIPRNISIKPRILFPRPHGPVPTRTTRDTNEARADVVPRPDRHVLVAAAHQQAHRVGVVLAAGVSIGEGDLDRHPRLLHLGVFPSVSTTAMHPDDTFVGGARGIRTSLPIGMLTCTGCR